VHNRASFSQLSDKNYMWFKNLYLYQFEKDFTLDAETLHEELSGKPFTECTALQRESMGWVPPLGKNSESFTHAANGFILLTMARQERLLPASVVREELDERVIEIQDRENRKVGTKEKKELRERIEDELLPRAFTRTQKMDAWIDPKGGWLVINTSSPSRAETFSTLLRKTIGSLPVSPPKTEAVSPCLTQWLADYKAPEPFVIGDECELKGSGDNTGVAAFKKHELGTDDVKTNLDSGKYVSKLALIWDNKVSFVVGEDMVVKKLKFLDVLDEKMNEQDPQSHEERMDIEFTLMTGELSQMIPELVKQFT
jgi:recombination associated protein RdgC